MVNRPMEIDGVKYFKCKKCGEVKPLNKCYFHINTMFSTGFNSKCKSCVKEERESKPKVKYITRAELEEENKTLKDNVEFLHSCLDDRDKSIAIMQEENKNLNKKIELLDNENMCLNAEIKDREEENKKLKEENEYRKSIVDIIPEGEGNVAEETIKDLQDRIKKLKEENEKLKEKRIFSLGEYDYMILTSTTPQLEIIKKNQNYSLME